MRLIKFASKYPEPQSLLTKRLILRRPQSSDFESWAHLRRSSERFLKPFEPLWAHDELSRSSYRARLRQQEADISSGRGLPWFLFSRSAPDQLMGGLTISNIRRGVADTGTLGYWMGESYAGQGFMSEAVHAICKDCFTTHRLHRIEAATVLENERSQRLLLNCHFQKEGIARQYLKIDGNWRDHVLFARLADDPVPND